MQLGLNNNDDDDPSILAHHAGQEKSWWRSGRWTPTTSPHVASTRFGQHQNDPEQKKPSSFNNMEYIIDILITGIEDPFAPASLL